MARTVTFTFRINDYERKILAKLANRLERSQSDSIRFLLRAAANEWQPHKKSELPSGSPEKEERGGI